MQDGRLIAADDRLQDKRSNQLSSRVLLGTSYPYTYYRVEIAS